MQGVGCDCALTQVQQQQGQLVLGGENALVVWACERASPQTRSTDSQGPVQHLPAGGLRVVVCSVVPYGRRTQT